MGERMTSRLLVWLTIALVLAILFRVILKVVNEFRYYRGMARKLFVDWIRQHRPEIEIVSEGPDAIRLRSSDGKELTFAPQQLYTKVDLTDARANEQLFHELLNQAIGRSRVA